MATFRPYIQPYKRRDGTYHVYIRVTHMRTHKYVPTPFYLTPDQVTKSLKIKDQRVLDAVENRIREYRERATRIGFLGDNLTIDHYIELLDNSDPKRMDFFAFAKSYIAKIRKSGRDGTADIYECSCNSLYRFNNEKPLFFSDIDKFYFKKYFDSLSGLKANSQRMYIGKIITIYKAAQAELNNPECGIIVAKYGVFDLITIPRRESSKDNAIKSVEQMQALIDEPYKGTWSYDFAKDMFILSFICMGTNMADFIRAEKGQYRDGILYYRRKKTEKMSGEDADTEILVPEVGRIIIDKYSGDKKYLINFQGHSRNSRFTRYIHYYFAKIGLEDMPEKLDDIGVYRSGHTFYANRHSMASFARNICGIDYMTVHQMLNHATPSSFKTTDVYLWKDYRPRWEANEKLYNLFDWSFYEKQKRAER